MVLRACPLRPSFCSCRPAGDAADKILWRGDEDFGFRSLQWAELRCEGGVGEPLAQRGDGALVIGTRGTGSRNLQARIAEKAMNGFAHQLADIEIFHNAEVARGRSGIHHVPRGIVVVSQIARQRDVVMRPRLLRHGVEAAVAHGIGLVRLEAARALDLAQLGHPAAARC